VLTVIEAILAMTFTSQFQTLSKNSAGARTIDIMGGVMTETQVWILGSALLVMTVLGLVLRYTMFGKSIRAIADDEEVAQIVGINSERVIGIVYFVGAAIAGLAGISIGFDTGIQPTMGMSVLLAGVVSVIVGGIGNVYGGVLGAFLLAVVENAGVWFLSGEWKSAIAFFVLIIFILFRPQGIWPK
jgi:branched-chain amino acid transport system permease protein